MFDKISSTGRHTNPSHRGLRYHLHVRHVFSYIAINFIRYYYDENMIVLIYAQNFFSICTGLQKKCIDSYIPILKLMNAHLLLPIIRVKSDGFQN